MGHYDEHYEAEAERERERIRELQSKCQHKEWKPVRWTKEGQPIATRCQECQLLHEIGRYH